MGPKPLCKQGRNPFLYLKTRHVPRNHLYSKSSGLRLCSKLTQLIGLRGGKSQSMEGHGFVYRRMQYNTVIFYRKMYLSIIFFCACEMNCLINFVYFIFFFLFFSSSVLSFILLYFALFFISKLIQQNTFTNIQRLNLCQNSLTVHWQSRFLDPNSVAVSVPSSSLTSTIKLSTAC